MAGPSTSDIMDIETLPRTRHPEKAHRPDNPILRKPEWIRVKAPVSAEYHATRQLMRGLKLTTVCEEAGCPNIGECWTKRHATFMIMGDICTRACAFCNVATGKPVHLDSDEPRRVGEAVATLGLQHVVVTSVDRDDLEDGGARHFARPEDGAALDASRAFDELRLVASERKDAYLHRRDLRVKA